MCKEKSTLENSIESFLWTFNKDEDPYFSISNADDTFNDVALIINNYISSFILINSF